MEKKGSGVPEYRSVFEVLDSIQLDDLVQKKGPKRDSPKFIAWATAWREVKRRFPLAHYEIIRSSDNRNYHHDQKTAWVEVRVHVPNNQANPVTGTIDEENHLVMLPIMDNRNASISVEKLTSFDVNNAHQRALVKGLALAGFGLEMWIKDDVLDRIEAGAEDGPKTAKEALANDKNAPSRAKKEQSGDGKPQGQGSQAPGSGKSQKVVVTINHPDWEKIMNYISENRSIGLAKIVKNLEKRYTVTKEIMPLFEQQFAEGSKQNVDSDE